MVMFKLDIFKVLLAVTLFTAVLAGWALQGYASKTDLVDMRITSHKDAQAIELTQGMAEVVELDGEVADVLVANPSLVDVSALKSNKLYLVGLNLGTTNIITLDAEGDVLKRFNVHVKIDDEALNATLKELFPDEDVQVKTLTDQVILSGTVHLLMSLTLLVTLLIIILAKLLMLTLQLMRCW